MKEDNDHGTVFLDYTQTVDGIKVFQGQVQVVVNKNGEVLSVREGFLVDHQQVRLRPALSEADGIAKAFEYAGKPIDASRLETLRSGSQLEMSRFANPIEPGFQEVLSELNVVRVGDASHLAWHVYVNVGPAESYEILVDAHNGELLLRNNLVSDAQGTVYTRSPNQGARQLVFFQNSWLGTSVVSTGNNVDACIDADHNTVCDPTSGNGLLNGRSYAPNQDFTFPFSTPGDPRLYPAAVVTNLFYFANYMHDFL
jgi:Zn-dependent metalloprotease